MSDSHLPPEQPSAIAPQPRRSFIGRFFAWLGIGSLCGSFVASVVSNIRFFFPKILYEPPTKFKAGYPEDYAVGEINENFKKEQKVWIIRTEDGIEAYEAICTHLGCMPIVSRERQGFYCPCHGSVFNGDGDVVAGPAPVPLYRYGLSLGPDGQIVVNKALRENRPGVREKPPFLLRMKA